MWSFFNQKSKRANSIMRKLTRQLISELKPNLPTKRASVWLTAPDEMTKGQVKELGIEIRNINDGDVYALCCFNNQTEHFGGSRVVTRGTKKEVAAWLLDKKNLETIAIRLQDLYENTHSWD